MPYAEYQRDLQAAYLQGEVGKRWGEANGVIKDAVVASLLDAIRCRFLETCPQDALAAFGMERNLEQGPFEDLNQYRARLRAAWDLWEYAGTALGITRALNLLGYPNVQVVENADWYAAPSPGYAPGEEWWRFWVIIDQPHGFIPVWKIGDGTKVGQKKVGSLSNARLLRDVCKTIHKWAPPHAQLQNIIIHVSGQTWGSFNWGDGTVYGGVSLVTSC